MTKAIAFASSLAVVVLTCVLSAPASYALNKKAADCTPKTCYQNYLKSLYYARDINEVSNFWSSKKSALWTSLPYTSKTKKLDYLKTTTYVGSYKFVSQKIDGNTAHLVINGVNVDGNQHRVNARIEADMVKEGAYWKIADAKTQYVGRPPVVASK